MAHRACFIFIKIDGKRVFYYARQASKYLDDALLGGLDGIAKLIQTETPINEEQWLSMNGGQDGELLFDFRNKVIIWFGESEPAWDPIYRRVFLKVVRQIWKDWDIRWEYNRGQDIREYAGYPLLDPYLDLVKQRPRFQLDPDRDGQITACLGGVLSIIDTTNQCRLIPLAQTVDTYLLSGPAFFAHWEAIPQLENLLINTIPLPYDEMDEPECLGGIHLNLSARKLDYWKTSLSLDMVHLISTMWPGWHIMPHYDEFEWQERITNGALRFKIKSDEEVLLEVFLEFVGATSGEAIRDGAFFSLEEHIGAPAKQPKRQNLMFKIFIYLWLICIVALFARALILWLWP